MNRPFPNPADASDAQIIVAVRALAPLVASTALQAETIDAARYLACVLHAAFQIVATESRARVDLAMDDGLRQMLDVGLDDVPPEE